MKKQELKNDPIKDYIINGYNYLIENKNLTYGVSSVIVITLFLFVFTNNQRNELNLNSSIQSGISQNLFLLSEQSGNDNQKITAVNNFNDLINGKHNKESINQAVIYLIKNAKDNNEDILDIINSNYFNSCDEFLNSYYNGIVGDYYSKLNDFKNAIKYYQKSIEIFKNHSDTLIDFMLSYIFALIQENDMNNAHDIFNSIDYDELSFGAKNKYDIFKNNYSVILK